MPFVNLEMRKRGVAMKRKLMITALAAALSLGANANTIQWGMSGGMISDLQNIPNDKGFSGDVIFILLESPDQWDMLYHMFNTGITSFNDVNIEASILGVWEADIFNVKTGSMFSTDNLGGRAVEYVQLAVLFLGSDTSNANYYFSVPSATIEDVPAGGGIITFTDIDPDVVFMGGYSFFYNIPEPGTGLLALVGASVLLLRRRKGIVAAASRPPDNG